MAEWEEVRLGDVCTKIGSGATPRGGKDAYLEFGEIYLIRSQNIYNGGFTPQGIAYISQEQADRLSNVTVEEGDVLLNITGDSVARSCIARREYLPARVNQHVAIIRTDKSKLDHRFLRYHLISPAMQNYMLGMAAAGATRNALTKGMIEAFSVPYPTLLEQQAIAGVLSALDDKIDLNRQMNATLEATARALFKSWFVDFDPVRAKMEGRKPDGLSTDIAALFPDKLIDSSLGEIPKGWEVKTLAEIVELNPSEKISKDSVAPYLDMAALSTAGFFSEEPRPRKVSSGSRFKNGDTLLARITPCLENGKTAYVTELEEQQIGWGSTEFIVMRPKAPCPAEYGYLLARDESFRTFAIQSMTGSSGRQRVPVEALGRYEIVMPPASLMQQFGIFVRPLFEKSIAAMRENQILSQLRDTLLPKLISGELRVADSGALKEAV